MRSTSTRLMTWLAAGVIVAGASALRANEMTFTGVVGDVTCGVTHKMNGPVEACTRACVKHGSDYALIADDTAYTLKASNKLKNELDKLAGHRVQLSGEQKGNTIQVTAVKAVM